MAGATHAGGGGKRPAPAAAEEVDAISEADLFLNFGRDAQAEEVLKEALRANPSNIPVQLKLLGIYANRKDINAFTTIARQIKDGGDTAAWEQTAVLGRTIDPGNPMYGTSGGETAAAAAAAAAAAVLVESGKQPSTVPLDMDIGFNIPMDLDVTAATPAVEASVPGMDFDVSGYVAGAPAMDMDVTSEHPVVPEPLLPDFDVTGGRPSMPPAPVMDFDVTGSHPNVTAAPLMDFDVTGSHPNVTAAPLMDFDVTGSHPNVTAAPAMDFDVTGGHPGVTETQRMDFDVTGGHPLVSGGAPGQEMSTVVLSSPLDFNITPPSTGGEAATGGLGGLDFDISGSPAPQQVPAGLAGMDFDISAAPQPKQEAEAAPLTLGGLDFDISAGLGAAAPAATPAGEALTGAGGMDFDLSAPASTAAPAGGGEMAGLGDMDMDFDLSAPVMATETKPEPIVDLGLSGINLNLGEADTVVLHAPEPKMEELAQEAGDEVANKLELAIAFQKMGDADTARELLGEVLKEGNAQQVEAARAAMQQL